MASAAWELQKSIYDVLVANAAVAEVLGGPRVYDAVPRAADLPYVTFGPRTTRDWSTGTETGAEHTLALRAWSKAGGARDIHRVLDAICGALEDVSLSITGHRLVNLRHEASDAVREPDGETWSGTLRFRAVTEPIP